MSHRSSSISGLSLLMDNILAIGVGLGLRFLVGAITRNDLRVGASLVGLWEGLVLDHFLQKTPRSFDPWLAFAVRLFIDFLLTESLWRLGVVALWAGMGLLLADIWPVLWPAEGLRTFYRGLPREFVSPSLPTLAFFPKTPRLVRFSPSSNTPVLSPDIPTSVTSSPLRSRGLPGSFPVDSSDTSSEMPRDLPPLPPSETTTTDSNSAETVPRENDPLSPSVSSSISHDSFATENGPRRRTIYVPSRPQDADDWSDDDENVVYLPQVTDLPTIPDLSTHGPTFPPSMLSTPHSPGLPSVPFPNDPRQDHPNDVDYNDLDQESMVDSDLSPPESATTAGGDGTLIHRAASHRQQAKLKEKERDDIKQRLVAAQSERRWKDAFLLRGDLEDVEEKIEQLHKKAAERFFRAHNPTPAAEEIDVHHLTNKEAVRAVNKKIRDLLNSGGGQLRVTVGRHRIHRIPELRKEIHNQHLLNELDINDPSVIIISLPA